jgi:copper chaperone CopZ
MNKTIVLAAIAALSAPVAVSAQAQATAAAAPARSGMVTVKVNGLVCDFCVQALTRTFKKEKAVDTFHVDLSAKEIHLTLKQGQTLSDARIRTLVTNAGYNVVGIARAKA